MLLAVAKDFCMQQGLDKTFHIAYSGGMDSHVLLAVFSELRLHLPIQLRAIHINHGLSTHASDWAVHCARICEAYQVPFSAHLIQIDLAEDSSLEEAARVKRYAVFADCMDVNDVLVTAHHVDDQAETVLIQLLRGAGTKGLAAMPVVKPFARGAHGRPFLSVPRATLREYALSLGLQWIEDESNANTNLTRNFIRHVIFPRLTSRWPTAAGMIARSGAHCAESQSLLEEYVADDCKHAEGSRAHTLSVRALSRLSAQRQRLVLRAWIHQHGYCLPNTRKMLAIQNDVLTAAWDRLPVVRWKETELRRYRDDLYLLPPLDVFAMNEPLLWDLKQPLELEHRTLEASLVKGSGFTSQLQQVTVQFRRGGETAEFAKRGRHTLKNLFLEWDVLPWERNRVPLLFDDGRLIAVVGYFLHEDYAVEVGELGWEVV